MDSVSLTERSYLRDSVGISNQTAGFRTPLAGVHSG